MRRRALADETEKVSGDISFRTRRSPAETGAVAPIAATGHEAGHVLAESLASAISCTVAVVPWQVLFMPSLGLSIKGFKRERGNRTAARLTRKSMMRQPETTFCSAGMS
jgi:hypothetical protein